MKRKIIKSKEYSEKIKELDERYGKGNYFIYEYEIDFSDTDDDILTEDTTIKTNLPKIGKAALVVHDKEGDNIPHFHVESTTSNFFTAIRLDKAEYFLHKPNHKMFRNKKQTKLLQKILFTKNKENKMSWELLVKAWNDSHDDQFHVILDKDEYPDYSKLPTSTK